jgi:WD40 repeat protein
MVHCDHSMAVMDLSFSPSGREFATASYDRTVRVFEARGGKSREVYHGRRMQVRVEEYILCSVSLVKRNTGKWFTLLGGGGRNAGDGERCLNKALGGSFTP